MRGAECSGTEQGSMGALSGLGQGRPRASARWTSSADLGLPHRALGVDQSCRATGGPDSPARDKWRGRGHRCPLDEPDEAMVVDPLGAGGHGAMVPRAPLRR